MSPVDGRVMFIIPWGNISYIGTTDTDFRGDPDAVYPTTDDVRYLLRSANALYPQARLQPDDVISAWAGLRPLLRPHDLRSPGTTSREHKLATGESGLISILGGKLTTYRSMSAETVDLISRRLHDLDGRPVPRRAPTDRAPLPGGEVRDLGLVIQDLVREGAAAGDAERLVRLYGTESAAIVRLARSDRTLASPVVSSHPATRAELLHAIRREMAITLSDLLLRRIHLFYEVPGQAITEAPQIVDFVAREMGWDETRKSAEIEGYLEEASRMMSFSETVPS